MKADALSKIASSDSFNIERTVTVDAKGEKHHRKGCDCQYY